MAPALAKYSHTNDEIRPYDLPMHNTEISDLMQKELSEKWSGLRGISVISVALGTVTLPPEDEKMIKEAQRNAINMNPGMAAATLVSAQADAMKAAANNASGAMNGFIGMNMANAAGGVNASDLFAMNSSNAAAPAADSWTCSCGSVNQGKFCANCGAGKPAPAAGWTCSCGSVNQGKFCANCGAKKPAGALLYKCDKCGWTPEDPSNPPKFCPQCGDPFDDRDAQ